MSSVFSAGCRRSFLTRPGRALGVGGLLLAAAALASLAIGAVDIPLAEIATVFASALGWQTTTPVDPRDVAVLMAIRLPRVVLGVVCGVGLSVAGAALQAVFRNPLADPMLIGVSSGAALAVTATIVAGGSFGPTALALFGPVALPAAGFAGGAAATALLYRVATREGSTSLATMLLAGIAINALSFAGIGLLTTVASNEQLRNISFWNFGSLAGATGGAVAVAAIVVVVAAAVLWRTAPALNALSIGEIEARHLGFETQALKRRVIVLSALMAGVLVAVCGVIGFVALVAPHVARLLVGADHRSAMPAAAIVGGILVLGADCVGRVVVSPAELPIGIVTALVGAPFFLWLLIRDRRASR